LVETKYTKALSINYTERLILHATMINFKREASFVEWNEVYAFRPRSVNSASSSGVET